MTTLHSVEQQIQHAIITTKHSDQRLMAIGLAHVGLEDTLADLRMMRMRLGENGVKPFRN